MIVDLIPSFLFFFTRIISEEIIFIKVSTLIKIIFNFYVLTTVFLNSSVSGKILSSFSDAFVEK